MYEVYWGLREKPFENTPDPRFYFASPQHQEACARMLYCIRERKGAGLLTGVFGCGKTVIGHVLLAELHQERYRWAYVSNPRLTDVDFLRMIARQLGMTAPPLNKADVLIGIEQIVNDNAREGRDTVVVVDEAHTIQDPSVFEELRLLLNFQWKDRFLTTLVLMGQPELLRMVEANKPFEQRLGMKAQLGPMTRDETGQYLAHRLRVAGHAQPESVFPAEAAAAIYEGTGGIPRRINRLADMALVSGMAQRSAQIDAALIKDAAVSVGV